MSTIKGREEALNKTTEGTACVGQEAAGRRSYSKKSCCTGS